MPSFFRVYLLYTYTILYCKSAPQSNYYACQTRVYVKLLYFIYIHLYIYQMGLAVLGTFLFLFASHIFVCKCAVMCQTNTNQPNLNLNHDGTAGSTNLLRHGTNIGQRETMERWARWDIFISVHSF